MKKLLIVLLVSSLVLSFGCGRGAEKAEVKKSTEIAKKAETKTEAEQADPWADEEIEKFMISGDKMETSIYNNPTNQNIKKLEKIYSKEFADRLAKYLRELEEKGQRHKITKSQWYTMRIWKQEEGIKNCYQTRWPAIENMIEGRKILGQPLDKVAIVEGKSLLVGAIVDQNGVAVKEYNSLSLVNNFLVLTNDGWRCYESHWLREEEPQS